MTQLPTQIGPYEISREIGRGGMGVVYLARDTKLDRDVAIKCLPEELADDADRLARFEREAKLLASLNHPNIATIHGLEEVDGKRYLILEYVEGETLEERLRKGAIEVDETLLIAIQIAEAIEAAHDKGVIHRDLKPANIKVTAEDQVKVLDFGLAKALDDQPSSITNMANSPTMVQVASPTLPGVILGTAGYLSPEQARGRPVDKRTDIFSFGCVLYEMLTGQQTFAGETAADSIGATLHKDIDFSALPIECPPLLRSLLARLLERDKAARLCDAGDIALNLQDALAELHHPSRTDRPGSRRPTITAVLVVAIGVVALGAGLMLGGEFGGSDEAGGRPPLDTVRFRQITDVVGVEGHPSISPDGSSVLYESKVRGNWDIFLVRVGGRNPINLTPFSDEDDKMGAFSPDGEQIVFRSERDGGGLFVMGATGESPRRLTDDGFDPAWSPDSLRVIYTLEPIDNPQNRNTYSAMWEIVVETGQRNMIHDGDAVQASYAPDGKWITFWTNKFKGGIRDIYVIPARGGEPIAITDDPPTDWNPVFAPDGRHIYFSSNRTGGFRIWRIGFDTQTGHPIGTPQPVTTAGLGDDGWLSVSADGSRLVFLTTVSSHNIERINLDPTTGEVLGAPEAITTGNGIREWSDVSPDGGSIAYISRRPKEDLIIRDLTTGRERQITDDPYRVRGPRWSPSGDRIAFYSDRAGSYDIWTIRPDGSGLTRIDDGERQVARPSWSPDGRSIAAIRIIENARGLIFDLERGSVTDLSPPPDGVQVFGPTDWSLDGSALIGDLTPPSGIGGIGFFDIEHGTYRQVDTETSEARFFDEHRVVTGTYLKLWLTDLTSGKRQALLSMEEDILAAGISIAHDRRAVYYSRITREADVWMLEFDAPPEDSR